jgi:adenosylcobinamide-phosphate synthase
MISIWAAFGLDLLIGDPYWFPHPVRFIGKYISLVEKSVRRFFSSPVGLRIGGVILVLTTVTLSFLVPYLLLFALGMVHPWLYYIGNIVLLWTCLAAKCLRNEGMKVFFALKEGDISKARTNLSYIVGRDTESLEEEEIVKATVETVVENTSDGVIAPLFYMMIGGAPLAMAYKAINTMDSMVGYKNDRFINFGWAAAKLDDLVNFIPARITGIFLIPAALFLRLNWRDSWRIMLRDRKNHTSPNCGYPEAAAAGALGIRLGGAHTYFHKVFEKQTIGDHQRPAVAQDISQSIGLMYFSSLIALLVGTIIWALRGSFS